MTPIIASALVQTASMWSLNFLSASNTTPSYLTLSRVLSISAVKVTLKFFGTLILVNKVISVLSFAIWRPEFSHHFRIVFMWIFKLTSTLSFVFRPTKIARLSANAKALTFTRLSNLASRSS